MVRDGQKVSPGTVPREPSLLRKDRQDAVRMSVITQSTALDMTILIKVIPILTSMNAESVM